MKYQVAVLGMILAAMLATPVQASEPGGEKGKAECKKIVINAGDGEKLVALTEGEGCKVITISEDGKEKVIKLKGGQPLDLDAKLDTETRLKLLDAKIAHLKATGQLKTDLAVKRVEAEKLETVNKPDAEIAAKKKEIKALRARLEDARLGYKQKVRKLVPEDLVELYMLGLGDETDLLELNLGLGAGLSKRLVKCIELQVDDDEEESD